MSAKILAFPNLLKEKPVQGPLLPPSKEVTQRMERRASELAPLCEWVGNVVRASVQDWHEVFAFAQRHAEFQRGLYAGRDAERDAEKEEEYESEVSFWQRCAAIYAKHVTEVERLAAEARRERARRGNAPKSRFQSRWG